MILSFPAPQKPPLLWRIFLPAHLSAKLLRLVAAPLGCVRRASAVDPLPFFSFAAFNDRAWRLSCRPLSSMMRKQFNVLPGFSLTLGFTLFYLSAIVLIPFAGLVIRACGLSWSEFWRLATTERALAAYRLTFGASLVAATANDWSSRAEARPV
jgi:hypothetical protein